MRPVSYTHLDVYKRQVNPCRADIGQRVRRKRAVRALRQSNEPMAADLLLDGSREGARRGGIRCV